MVFGVDGMALWIEMNVKWRAAGFEWFTGGADRSENAQEKCGKRGSIVDGYKSDDIKIPHELETFNSQKGSYKKDSISSAPVETRNDGQGISGGK